MKIDNAGIQNSIATVGAGAQTPAAPERSTKGPSFQDTLTALQGMQHTGTAPTTIGPGKGKPTAGQVGALQTNANLNLARAPGLVPGAVKFSNHAVERMVSRGISFTPQDLQRINEAVDKAAAKGSKDSLLLMDESALIVSVKNKTVVTVMDKATMKENVFTNIDSTIVM